MRSFLGITNSNYKGSIVALPTDINNTKFGQQPALPPSCVALTFDWANDYGASTAKSNIAVPVNIGSGGTTRQKLDNLRSVRIDNLGNPVPVYVNFPDTNYTVACPPNSIVRENVETGQFGAFIYAEGFTTGQAGSTAVYFYNYPSSPFLDTEISQAVALWKSSPKITNGNSIFNQNFGIPALGDQIIQGTIPLVGTNVSTVLNPDLNANFFYLSAIELQMLNANNPGGAQQNAVFFESTGLSGILFQWDYYVPTATFGDGFVNITRLTGLNIKISSRETWRLRNSTGSASGTMLLTLGITTSPT